MSRWIIDASADWSTASTGTFSLYQALNKLGYRSYHMFELHKSALHFDLFEEALKAKHYGVGKPYGKEEFDKWLAEYDVGDGLFLSFSLPLFSAWIWTHSLTVVMSTPPRPWSKSQPSSPRR